MERQRDAGIDLLRILATLMVVGTHVLGRGGILGAAWGQNANAAVASVFKVLFMSAVNCFGIISGYFLCRSRFRLARVLKLWSEVLFYSLLFTAARLLIEPRAVSPGELLSAVFPLSFRRPWYVSAYLGLLFLTPFLNRLLRTMSRRQHLALALVSVLLFSVHATLSLSNTYGVGNKGHSTLWLAVLYILGAYFRMHLREYPRRASALVLGGAVAATVASVYLIGGVTGRLFGSEMRLDWFVRDISPTIVAISAALFHLLKGLSAGAAARRLILWTAPLAFGVYLSHMQPLSLSWFQGKLGAVAGIHPLAFPFAVLGIMLFIFAAGIALEFLRARLFRLVKFDSALALIERKALSVWGRFLGLARKVF
ncbi:MAG: acyltransferase [Clostridiales bacterium]|nr:acyltransferase [Clostridiales bacterium]